MFPRIVTVRRKDKTYQYLVISESVRIKGKGSTTRNVANLGNIERFQGNNITSLIDGLIRLFQVDQYALTEDVEILESLEHGNILLWQKLWDDLGLSEILARAIHRKEKQVTLEVEKYIQIMVVNRCVEPLSKLGATRWVETTCYKMMKGYTDLSLDVNHFYRSMDYLLRVKDEVELAVFRRLQNLFSINVTLTFYDITSSFFYSDSCPISENGYSRDARPDLEQIVIGVVTSYEGYPIKHYVFTGNTKDETTVAQVVNELKSDYSIEETTFFGDRGMITKLNLDRIAEEGFDYIMGVKQRQDEICRLMLADMDWPEGKEELHHGLRIQERHIEIKTFLLRKTHVLLTESGFNPSAEALARLHEKILALTNEDTPEYANYKPCLEPLVGKGNAKLCQKVFRLIKKYQGRYNDSLRYIVCRNDERKRSTEKKREEMLAKLTEELNKWAQSKAQDLAHIERGLNKIFEGYKGKYKKFFEIDRDEKSGQAIGYHLNQETLTQEKKWDGVFVLLTSREDLSAQKVVDSYKDLKEVEMLFDDLKHFVDIRPIRHWLNQRVRAHVFLCILALLLKRVFEINYLGGKATTEPLEALAKSKLVKYKVKFSKREERSQVIPKITTTTPIQKKYFKLVGIKNPMSLERFVW